MRTSVKEARVTAFRALQLLAGVRSSTWERHRRSSELGSGNRKFAQNIRIGSGGARRSHTRCVGPQRVHLPDHPEAVGDAAAKWGFSSPARSMKRAVNCGHSAAASAAAGWCRLLALTLLVLMLLTATACHNAGSLRISASAVDDAARGVGAASRELVLTSDDVAHLAQEAQVTDDVIRGVAPQVDSLPQWRQQLSHVGEVYQQVQDSEAAQIVVGVSCDGLKGKISTSADVYDSLVQQLPAGMEREAQQLAEDSMELWQDMYTAFTTGTDQDRAAVSLACYTYANIG